jgi:hypothetical protein
MSLERTNPHNPLENSKKQVVKTIEEEQRVAHLNINVELIIRIQSLATPVIFMVRALVLLIVRYTVILRTASNVEMN